MSCQAQALILERDLTLRVGEVAVPAPGQGEVRIRVRWAGVGDADQGVLRTGAGIVAWPAVLGREVVGEVDVVGAGVVDLVPGQPVVLDPRLPCGRCAACTVDPNRCLRPRVLGLERSGGLAELVTVPEPMVHELPETLDAAVAVLAVPLAVAMHAVAGVSVTTSDVAVVGYGSVGALIHLELRRRDPERRIQIVESDPTRAAIAEAHGAVVVDEFPNDVSVVLDARCRTAFVDEFPAAIARLTEEPMRYRSVITEHVAMARAAARVGREARAPSSVALLVAMS